MTQFEKFWNVDLEEEIVKHNQRYEAERKAAMEGAVSLRCDAHKR